jgi:hypothetical protein
MEKIEIKIAELLMNFQIVFFFVCIIIGTLLQSGNKFLVNLGNILFFIVFVSIPFSSIFISEYIAKEIKKLNENYNKVGIKN